MSRKGLFVIVAVIISFPGRGCVRQAVISPSRQHLLGGVLIGRLRREKRLRRVKALVGWREKFNWRGTIVVAIQQGTGLRSRIERRDIMTSGLTWSGAVARIFN